jgi:hypothetical protein
MDRSGVPISAPQPKHYDVSHGMCRVCGLLWLERALGDTEDLKPKKKVPIKREVRETSGDFPPF